VKAGDLVRDTETRDVGLIVKVDYNHAEAFGSRGAVYPYRVLSTHGSLQWLEQVYIEKACEVISPAKV
jgi:hypothetical protein